MGENFGVTGAVGTGPFKLESFSIGLETVLTRNEDDAWASDLSENQGAAHLSRIVFREIPDQSTAFLELMTGGVGALAFAFSSIVGIILGTISATTRSRIMEQFVRGFILLGSSVPGFWLALLMILLVAVQLQWFPVSGAKGWDLLVLPVLTIGFGGVALVARVTRVALLDALIFMAIIGPGLTSTTFAIAIAYLAQFTRLTRTQIVRLKRETFIEATINLGAKPRHILLRHLLPNAIAPVIVGGMLAIGDGIVLEATLGLFGLGAQPPTPSWGAMMSSGTAQLFLSPWVIIFPGVVVAVTVVAVNLFGDELIRALGIRDRIRGHEHAGSA